MVSDLGVGLSTLNKWVTAHRDTDVVSDKDLDLARENERLQRRHPHWIAPLQRPARTGIDSHVARLVASPESLICPGSNVRTFVCLSLSSTPP